MLLAQGDFCCSNPDGRGIPWDERKRVLRRSFEWGREGQEFDLLKTIIAFANGGGGKILLEAVLGNVKQLDSARLDDFANKYVSPRLGGIQSTGNEDGSWTITVSKSPFAPHVISQEASYEKAGKMKSAFYPGQVYVRHSSKSEPARGEDLQRIIRESVSSWLESLGRAVGSLSFAPSESEYGMPVRIVEGGPTLAISLADSHPYTASDIGEPLDKRGSWIGAAVNKLGLRNDRATAYASLETRYLCTGLAQQRSHR